MHDLYDRLHTVFSTSAEVFYRYGDEMQRYADAYRLMRRQNGSLRERPKGRILLATDKCFETYAAVFSILLSGNVWMPISPKTPAQRVCEIVEAAAPTLVVVDDTTLPETVERLAELDVAVISLADFGRGDEHDFNDLPDDMDADGIIYFTSGSTGKPKGVRLTHRNFAVVVGNIMDMLPLRTGEVFGDYHDLGFVISVPILFPCVLSQSAVSPARTAAETMLPVGHLTGNEVSVLITVPSTIARIRQSRRLQPGDLILNVLISCGEPLHLDVLTYAFEDMTPAHLFNFYGSTEVAPWIFSHHCEPADAERFAPIGYIPIGTPMADNDIATDDDTGELLVAGPKITPGYLNNENPEKFFERDGKRWFRMGDIVDIQDGLYVCKGRVDSQVKIRGYRVDLLGVEAQLRALSGVDNGICFASGNDERTQIVAVLQTGNDFSVSDVHQALSEKLPSYMHPERVICLQDVPLNKSGKIDRAALKATYA